MNLPTSNRDDRGDVEVPDHAFEGDTIGWRTCRMLMGPLPRPGFAGMTIGSEVTPISSVARTAWLDGFSGRGDTP